MTRESMPEDTFSATRLSMFDLMRPVTTFADGRCVAMTRWMPAARASCAMRTMEASTSFPAVIMRSESSSITTTMYGIGSGGLSISDSLPVVHIWLYTLMFLAPARSNTFRRRSISLTAHCSALAAWRGSVTTGTYRWGSPL